MNSKYNEYISSVLEKARIMEYARKLAKGASRPTDFVIEVNGKEYSGWLLAQRNSYREETYGQWDYVRRIEEKHTYYLTSMGSLKKHVFYYVDNAGEDEERRSEVFPFSDDDFYLFDCPEIKIDKLIGKKEDMYVSNLRFDIEKPFYSQKGVGLTKLLKALLTKPQKSELDKLMDD